MKRILVGLTLLAMVIAGGAVAWAQAQPSDPLTARVTKLQEVYQQVVLQIGDMEAQLLALNEQKLRLEGGILELQRYQQQNPIQVTGVVLPPEVGDATVETEPE